MTLTVRITHKHSMKNPFENLFKKKEEPSPYPEPKDEVFNKPLEEVDLEQHKADQRDEELQKELANKKFYSN